MSGCPALRLSGFGLTLDGEPGLDSEQRGRGLLALWVSGLGLTAEHGPEPTAELSGAAQRWAYGCGHPLGSPPPASLPREPSRAAGKQQREGAIAQDTVAAWGTGLRS